jgi:hypothetical protein
VESFWDTVDGASGKIRQGDLVPGCLVPVFDLGSAKHDTKEVIADEYDLIVITQSCDLEQGKVRLVATCPVYSILEFETANPPFSKKGRWNEVLKGRIEGLHLLSSPVNPDNNREAVVVDFREIYSLPLTYLARKRMDDASTPRYRLRSPYLEHFSQAFARFFMRVGLPSTIAPFP